MAIDWGEVLGIGAAAAGAASGDVADAAPAATDAAAPATATAMAPAATDVAGAAPAATGADAAGGMGAPLAGTNAAGGVAGGNMQSQLFTDMQDPTKADAMAAQMATHFDPPAGAHDFSTGATAAPGSAPAPGPEKQMQLSDVPKYTGPPAPPPAAAKSGMSPEQRARMESAFKAGGQAAQLGGQIAQSQEQRPPQAPGGGPRSGTFTGLNAAQGLPAQGMTPPGMQAGPNAMMPAQQQGVPVGQTPANLAQLYGRPYG